MKAHAALRLRAARDLLLLEALGAPPVVALVFAADAPDVAVDPVVPEEIDPLAIRGKNRVLLARVGAGDAVRLAEHRVAGPEFALRAKDILQPAGGEVRIHRAGDLPQLLRGVCQIFLLADRELLGFTAGSPGPQMEGPAEDDHGAVPGDRGPQHAVVLEGRDLPVLPCGEVAAPQVEGAVAFRDVIEAAAIRHPHRGAFFAFLLHQRGEGLRLQVVEPDRGGPRTAIALPIELLALAAEEDLRAVRAVAGGLALLVEEVGFRKLLAQIDFDQPLRAEAGFIPQAPHQGPGTVGCDVFEARAFGMETMLCRRSAGRGPREELQEPGPAGAEIERLSVRRIAGEAVSCGMSRQALGEAALCRDGPEVVPPLEDDGFPVGGEGGPTRHQDLALGGSRPSSRLHRGENRGGQESGKTPGRHASGNLRESRVRAFRCLSGLNDLSPGGKGSTHPAKRQVFGAHTGPPHYQARVMKSSASRKSCPWMISARIGTPVSCSMTPLFVIAAVSSSSAR